jgi:hypothetical protein
VATLKNTASPHLCGNRSRLLRLFALLAVGLFAPARLGLLLLLEPICQPEPAASVPPVSRRDLFLFTPSRRHHWIRCGYRAASSTS